MTGSSTPTVVLVHGGFVDGAGWEGVYNVLKKDGYNVSVVQNPTTSLADDVAATRLVIAQAQGPVVLVGHSYGGVVVTEAGTDPKVRGSSTSRRSPRIRASPSSPSSKIRLPARRFRRSCRRRTAICSSTRRNSAPRLQRTSAKQRPHSWPTLRCHGASTRSAGSVTEPAWKTSRAGIWSRPRTR